MKFNFSIESIGEVFPKEKWILERGNNGQITSRLIDYESGHVIQYNLNQFERGEFVSLKLSFDAKKKKYFNKGDTILTILSSNVEERLSELEGEFKIAKENLVAQSTGQKESLIKEARNKLNYIEEKINQQKILFQRANSLYEKDLISKQEFETQKWLLDLYEIEKNIYKAQLENLSTGVKPQEISLIKTQIIALENRLKILKNRKTNLIITSPISGYKENVYSPDTLMTLININEVILHVPIRITDLEALKNNQSVNIFFPDLKKNYTATIVAISNEVKLLNNQQVIFISIKLNNKEGIFLPGMLVNSEINVRKISLLESIKRLLNS
ncbi:HlyD family secretion protein [Rosettibacter firmus]|uniref:HlyD family secretion protein n=1 Tax=Rosettibacter firmus TaxID=3111522 RepID=UPI00336BBB54